MEPEEQTLEKQRRDLRRLWRLFYFLTRQYLAHAPNAKLNFVWVIILSVIQSAFNVVFSYISRDFWTSLQYKDVDGFWRQIFIFTVVLLVALPVLVWYSYEKDRLAIRWRRWHTEKVLVDYLAYRNYYEIDQRGVIDNPDQRISQDVEAFTTNSLNLFTLILSSLLDLINFSAILFTIYPKLFIVLILYASCGTVVTFLIGRRLINLNFKQLQREADFRYSLIRVRENAESIAFYKGEARERMEVVRRFFAAFVNRIDIIVWQRNLGFFVIFYRNVPQILPLSIVAPIYFSGAIDMGTISQSLQAFNNILTDLSLIIDQFDGLSAFSAGIDRLGEFEEFMCERFVKSKTRESHVSAESDPIISDAPTEGSETSLVGEDENKRLEKIYGRWTTVKNFQDMKRHTLADSSNNDANVLPLADDARLSQIATTIVSGDTPRIEVSNLSLRTPNKNGRLLFSDMSFTLEPGERLLIAGPSGTGKSSALRALAGLWTVGSGHIERPALERMFFLPQKPYCTLGSLREQLVYPTPVQESNHTTEELLGALERVGLAEVPERMGGLDSEYDWSNVLSLGEQQRLAFARLIVGRPVLAILDECSSALDVASEDKLYSYLRESGISFISVGHRPTIVKYHDKILRMAGSSGGATCSIEKVTEGTLVDV